MPPRDIAIANRHPGLRLDRRTITRAIHLLDAHFSFGSQPTAFSSRFSAPPGELSVVFVTDAELAKLHADFLADPTPTDVITFEGDPAFGTAGEICVSADAAARQVGLPVGGTPPSSTPRRTATALSAAFSTELTLYLVHGWLHLAGYDDLVPAKKRLMRRAEGRAMKLLRDHSHLPGFTLRPSSR